MSNTFDLETALGFTPSAEQFAAITAPLEPGVIVAGAGTGKTTVMAARVVWLVGSGQVRPAQVLGLTFTRKATAELAERIRSAFDKAKISAGCDRGEENISTYDSFARQLVADYGLLLGMDTEAKLMNDATRFRLAYEVVSKAAGPFESLSRLRPTSLARAVLGLAATLSSNLVSFDALTRADTELVAALTNAPLYRGKTYKLVEKAMNTAAEREELLSLVVSYEQCKRERGFVEFADLLADAVELAALEPVATALRQSYRIVLLDEYQDTSPAQAELLYRLFSGNSIEAGRGHPVTAVGDPSQAIYGWRGAASANISEFKHQFTRADGSVALSFPLTINRRSGKRILDVANALSSKLPEREAGAANELRAADEPLHSQIHTAAFDTQPEELSWICDRILQIVEIGSGSLSGLAFKDIAVLGRTNSQLAQVYAELSQRDIPAEVVGLGGLLEVTAVAEVVAVLQVLADLADNPAMTRVLTSRRWAIGAGDLALLGKRAAALARSTTLSQKVRADGAAEKLAAGGLEDSNITLMAGDSSMEDSSVALLAGRNGVEGGSSVLTATEVGKVAVSQVATQPAGDNISLLAAVADPGTYPFSQEARSRFKLIAAEFSQLHSWLAAPLPELVSHVIDILGLEAELAAGTLRGQPLAHFISAVTAFVSFDQNATLSALLAYLDAEREEGIGLEQPDIGEDDSVKLLTIHKAKGLEWPVVFIPGLTQGAFPNKRGEPSFLSDSKVIPATLRGDAAAIPQLLEPTNPGIKAYQEALVQTHRDSEDRLAYVVTTRAKQAIFATTHRWSGRNAKPKAVSPYWEVMAAHADTSQSPRQMSTENPLVASISAVPWPALVDDELITQAAIWVREAAERLGDTAFQLGSFANFDQNVGWPPDLHPDELTQAKLWLSHAQHLQQVASDIARSSKEVVVPSYLSVTAISKIAADPSAYAAKLANPMPQWFGSRQQIGSQFHEWFEQSSNTPLTLDEYFADDLEINPDLQRFIDAYQSSPYAALVPVGVEVPFTLVINERIIRGRIDAIYAEPQGVDSRMACYQIVDWKTGDMRKIDPLQLSIYRLAWAQLQGVTPQEVDAVFYDLRQGQIVRTEKLHTLQELEEVIVAISNSK